jgi:tRNA pseudouridine55 synthase
MNASRTVMSGVINFLKPPGMSSHDAVAFLRRISGVRRIGHTGTLDPMAAGVLPLCVGKATRITEYLALAGKRYRCEMRLGVVTDTQDVWGRVLSKADDGFASRLSEQEIRETAARFVGKIMQIPPAYSAVKLNGKKLYEYARAGAAVSVPARRIEIARLNITRVDLTRGVVLFDAECSKGSYMRTLCHDIGAELGCGAVMSGLIRTACGMFELEDAHTAESLGAAFSPGGSPESVLTPTDIPLTDLLSLTLSQEASRAFINGARVDIQTHGAKAGPAEDLAACAADSREQYRVYGDVGSVRNAFLGVGRINAGALVADKVFFEV